MPAAGRELLDGFGQLTAGRLGVLGLPNGQAGAQLKRVEWLWAAQGVRDGVPGA